MKIKHIHFGLIITLVAAFLAFPAQANELRNSPTLPAQSITTSPQVIVYTDRAEICLSDTQQCFPALVGASTPLGVYDLTLYSTHKKGYGGDILGFKIEGDFIFALHRVWLGKPSERRLERLRSGSAAQRKMTNGCINVENDVYDLIKDKYYTTINIR